MESGARQQTAGSAVCSQLIFGAASPSLPEIKEKTCSLKNFIVKQEVHIS